MDFSSHLTCQSIGRDFMVVGLTYAISAYHP